MGIKSVLSIDFDYFQDVPHVDLLHEYPDGIDLPPDISEIVWGSKYVFENSRSKLLAVQPWQQELDILHNLLQMQDSNATVLISSSHLDIYNWLHKNISKGESFILHNIDMHHDLFNENANVDCGNWVGHIFEDYGRNNIQFKWFINPITMKMYGFTKHEQQALNIATGKSLQEIADKQYQYIFLCRSDNWLPPHLDQAFADVVALMEERFVDGQALIDVRVREPRNYLRVMKQLQKGR